MQGFVKEKEFYKQAACIAIPISLQSVITIGVSMMDNIMVGAMNTSSASPIQIRNMIVTTFFSDVMSFIPQNLAVNTLAPIPIPIQPI